MPPPSPGKPKRQKLNEEENSPKANNSDGVSRGSELGTNDDVDDVEDDDEFKYKFLTAFGLYVLNGKIFKFLEEDVRHRSSKDLQNGKFTFVFQIYISLYYFTSKTGI